PEARLLTVHVRADRGARERAETGADERALLPFHRVVAGDQASRSACRRTDPSLSLRAGRSLFTRIRVDRRAGRREQGRAADEQGDTAKSSPHTDPPVVTDPSILPVLG